MLIKSRKKMERKKYVDLHMHSYYSDGITDPRTLIRSSVLMGIEVIALTDHDTTDGFEEPRRKQEF